MSNTLTKKEIDNLVILKKIIENNKKNAKTVSDLADSVEQLYISMVNLKEEFEHEVTKAKKEIEVFVNNQISDFNDRMDIIDKKLDAFDNRIPLTRSEVGLLYNVAKNKINELCIEKVNRDNVKFSDWYKKITQRVWGRFRRHFNISRYYDLPKRLLQEGINYLNNLTLDDIDYENKYIKF